MVGKSVYAITKAEFLNKAFGTNYEEYTKPFWTHPDGRIVWMFYADGKVRDDYKVDLFKNKLIERYSKKNCDEWKLSDTSNFTRVAVGIILSRVTEFPFIFVILGTYELSLKESKLGCHVWHKVNDGI